MAAARACYLAAAAVLVAAMLGRLACTDQPFLLDLAGGAAVILVVLFWALAGAAVVLGIPALLLVLLVTELVRRSRRRGSPATPVPASGLPPGPVRLPGVKEAA